MAIYAPSILVFIHFLIYFLSSSIFIFIISICLWLKTEKRQIKIDTTKNHFFLNTTKSLWVLSSATVLMEWSAVLLTVSSQILVM